eukprot:CAMPEP_0119143734 /NCGR_PEP_ID=MMETSP1310-20130426/34775_1 /TAXON_ID=464262 /ORGANISM="Genus nov. species nov., Strain RCC2339" /LENGTH=162 /DNA_ID=CAMNT_0007135393 /DNA_START=38 /DNA_END=526 /DNA_ORIENTATION=-
MDLDGTEEDEGQMRKRELERVEEQMRNLGYKDGLEGEYDDCMEQGFHDSFPTAAALGYRAGVEAGIATALVKAADKGIVKCNRDGLCQFVQSLYASPTGGQIPSAPAPCTCGRDTSCTPTPTHFHDEEGALSPVLQQGLTDALDLNVPTSAHMRDALEVPSL